MRGMPINRLRHLARNARPADLERIVEILMRERAVYRGDREAVAAINELLARLPERTRGEPARFLRL